MTQILPQLAKEAKLTSILQYVENDAWIMEQKLDGHRLLLCSPGGDYPPTALTRNGSAYTRRLPKALQDFRFPDGNGPMDFILDGELVAEVVNGHTVNSIFHVFDIIVPNILPLSTPLRLRRHMLEESFEFWARGNPNIKLVPQAKTPREKADLALRAKEQNLEGLILKHREAPYRSGGRTDEWLKFKFVTTADVFVTGVRTDGKDSVDLGMIRWTGNGILANSYEVVPVGRASLIGKEKKGTIAVGDVLEVRYLYTGAGGRLYQPTIVGKRTDKAMHECDVATLKHVNKAVLDKLP